MSASEVITRTEIVARTLPIRAWPKSERPREKLIDKGAHALSDAELLAVLLRSGTRGRNAIELAQAHIVAFGSLRELLTAEVRTGRFSSDLVGEFLRLLDAGRLDGIADPEYMGAA